MKPMGTIPYFLAALRSLLRARSLAASSSNATWLKRASAFRTCGSSLIGSRRRPLESTYAKALLGNCDRFFALSWLMAVRFALGRPLARRAAPRSQTILHLEARRHERRERDWGQWGGVRGHPSLPYTVTPSYHDSGGDAGATDIRGTATSPTPTRTWKIRGQPPPTSASPTTSAP